MFPKFLPPALEDSCKEIKALTNWRRDVEKQFRYQRKANSNIASEIDRKLNRERIKLEQDLVQGIHRLQQINRSVADERKILQPKLEKAAKLLAQAKANRKALG